LIQPTPAPLGSWNICRAGLLKGKAMKPKKFKNRHKLKLSETIGLSDIRIRENLDYGTRRAFPDKQKRMEYMRALMQGLED